LCSVKSILNEYDDDDDDCAVYLQNTKGYNKKGTYYVSNRTHTFVQRSIHSLQQQRLTTKTLGLKL